MIRVTLGTNTDRSNILVDPNKTIKEVLEANNISYSVSSLTLDGATLKAGDINKTFAEMGITESCFLIVVAKAENAVA